MTTDAIVFLPGIMGSELRDRDGTLIWGLQPSLLFRNRRLRDVIGRLAFHDGEGDGVIAGGPVRFPGWLPMLDGIEPYEKMVKALRAIALRPDAVLTFGYDWRRSVEYNAAQLRGAVIEHLMAWQEQLAGIDPTERGRDDPRVTFVCHSMGGIVARWFATFLDTDQVTRRIITFGTPFAGSVKAVRLVASGDIFRFGLLAEPLRTVARTMPGVHDLLPRYRAIDRDGVVDQPTIDDVVSVGAARDLVADAFSRGARLEEAAPPAAEIRSLAGVQQATLSSWSLAPDGPAFLETIEGRTIGGDGTVFQASAFLTGQTPGGYLPQKHGRLAGTDEAIAFTRAVLVEDELRQFQATDGPGLVVPSAATVGSPVEFEVTSWDGGSTIVIERADTGLEVDRLTPVRHGDNRVASTLFHLAGLYRVRLVAGGYSDVAELLGVLDPEDT
jgi:pimeloyl-ACP methyl ester carboxylesterase